MASTYTELWFRARFWTSVAGLGSLSPEIEDEELRKGR